MRGYCVGRRGEGSDLETIIPDCFLCISNEALLVLRATGTIPGWALLKEVHSFFYNETAANPYVAFLTDDGPPNVVFVPKAPSYGEQAASCFNARMEVKRIHNVVQAGCFQSVHVRRVIQCACATEESPQEFIRTYESTHNVQLSFKFGPNYPCRATDCPWPREDLMTVWTDMRTLYATRERITDGQAAIPIYQNNTNDMTLQPDQLPELSRRLARERTAMNDIVGIPYEEVQRVSALSRVQSAQNVANTFQTEETDNGGSLVRRRSVANGFVALSVSRNRREEEEGARENHFDPLAPPPSFDTGSPMGNSSMVQSTGTGGDDTAGSGIDNFQFDDSSEDEGAAEDGEDDQGGLYPYGVKGSRYFTRDEVEGGAAELVVEEHHVLASSALGRPVEVCNERRESTENRSFSKYPKFAK
ncbi:hypothetical protein AGDE_14094 [Angomonas deanei]|uniref:Uncharacterized protein n=1 Tax=Angomonas deanei TaxID=59799 RepID=A0A7G2C472_9TRYP|nr:hypothetical protein AGDE_14094 [Angomonas deanei]CAD2213523.1 hypothetical protein, conserved [Angomonas deanei]|eukprot:EPY21386.1 hypothetical protein AGDE_14094 [Angomonas deanei]